MDKKFVKAIKVIANNPEHPGKVRLAAFKYLQSLQKAPANSKKAK